MNFARVALAAVAAWVVSIPMGYVVNEIVLKDLYVSNAAAMRPEAEIMSNLPIGFGFMLVGFFAFAYGYAKGYEGGQGIMEGIRYGVLIGLMVDCFAIAWQGLTIPLGSSLVAAMMVDYIFEFALYGGIVGLVYKPAGAPVKRAAAV
jgi:hypothetical protein